MVIISAALVEALNGTADVTRPIIGYGSLVTVSNIAADHANADFPATNLANPQTSSFWKSGSIADQYITVTLDGTIETDYMAVARHNWGSGLVVTSVEGITAEPGAVWTELNGEQLLGDDAPAMFLHQAGFFVGKRFKLQPDAVEPQAAVVYVGTSLRLTRGIQVGHTPVKYGRSRQLTEGSASNGDYLGKIILSQQLNTTIVLKDLAADWYRSNLQPFIDVCREPFFFAWAPYDYPKEIGFGPASGDPIPVIGQRTGTIDISIPMRAVAL